MNDGRILNLSGGFNFRDLGGYESESHAKIKWHKLVRSGYLTNLTETDLERLRRYGIRIIVDLRSKSEIAHFPDQLHEDFQYISMPIFKEDQTESASSLQRIRQMYAKSEQSGFQKMMRSYRKMAIDEHAKKDYRKFFDLLLDSGADNGVLFHCSAGKDRTGMCTILLLAALGVKMETIREDYLLTNFASKKRVQWRIEEAKKMKLGVNFTTSVKDLVTVRDEYFDQLIGILEYQYGGLIQYLTSEIGLKPAEFQSLKEIYLS